MTKLIIGRGREFRGLYILDSIVPRPISCSGVTTPFKTITDWATPLLLLKKLCPQFSSFSSLDCESCQFAKITMFVLVLELINKLVLLLS